MGADPGHIGSLKVKFKNNARMLDNMQLSVLLFSPGIGIDRDMYTYLIERLVKEGYAVVTVGHIIDTLFTVMEDGKIVYQDEQVRALDFTDFRALGELLENRISDISCVIDRLEDWNNSDLQFKAKFNLTKIIGAGHS